MLRLLFYAAAQTRASLSHYPRLLSRTVTGCHDPVLEGPLRFWKVVSHLDTEQA
jgi:hypothetical protein